MAVVQESEPGYAPGAPTTPTAVATNVTAVPPATTAPPATAGGPAYHAPMKLSPNAANTKCPYCQHQGLTRLEKRIGTCAVVASVVLLFVFWPLFWVPLVSAECKDVDHYCANCGRKLGSHDAGECA